MNKFMRHILIVFSILLLVACRCGNDKPEVRSVPSLEIIPIERIDQQVELELPDKTRKNTTYIRNFILRNYIPEDSGQLKSFITSKYDTHGSDTVSFVIKFFKEIPGLTLSDINNNPRELARNERELTVIRYSISNKHLVSYSYKEDGSLKIVSIPITNK
jgi:hypothetical protein